MIRTLHRLFIFYVYVNILSPKFAVFGVPVSKITVGLIILLGTIHVYKTRTLPPGAMRYVVFSILLILFLALVGSLKGNEIQNILEFVFPVLLLPMIVYLVVLLESYGSDIYLKHVVCATAVLSLYVLALFLLCGPLGMKELAEPINMNTNLMTTIAFPRGQVRVNVNSSAFGIAGILIALYFHSKRPNPGYFLLIGLMSFMIYIGFSIGLWFGVAAGVVGYLLMAGQHRPLKAVLFSVFLVAVLVSYVVMPEDIVGDKESSIVQKRIQTSEAITLFEESPLFGAGLGFSYRSAKFLGVSGEKNLYLESTYPMILSSTGIVGAMCYLFIYGYYPLKYLFRFRRGSFSTICFLSHVGLVISAVGNPYLWGGGMGLFFIALLGASMEAKVSHGEKSSSLLGSKMRS